MTEINKTKIERIRNYVCNEYGITVSELNSKSRKTEFSLPRQIIHSLIKDIMKYSVTLSEIGYMIGIKDHATVLNSIKSIKNRLDTDTTFRTEYELFKEILTEDLKEVKENYITVSLDMRDIKTAKELLNFLKLNKFDKKYINLLNKII